jgi:hypothetical protein
MKMGSSNDIFQGASKVLVKQENALIECFGCEAKQRYRISVPTGTNGTEEGPTFLYITEDSGCLERQCCSIGRSLTLKVHAGADQSGPVVQSMKKPFGCSGCCCCLPKFEVFEGDLKSKIGDVHDPWRCCLIDHQVKGMDGNMAFTTSGSPFQFGMCCMCCADANFDVSKDGEKMGSLTKVKLNCAECTMPNTNRFLIDFGSVSDLGEKKLMLASAMLLDLVYFERAK